MGSPKVDGILEASAPIPATEVVRKLLDFPDTSSATEVDACCVWGSEVVEKEKEGLEGLTN